MIAQTILKALYEHGTQGRLEAFVGGDEPHMMFQDAVLQAGNEDFAEVFSWEKGVTLGLSPNARRVKILCSTDVGAALVEVLEAARALANEPDDPALDGPLRGALDRLDALLSERGRA